MAASDKNGGAKKVEEYYAGMDAYEILGVPRTADMATIKKAYKKGRQRQYLLPNIDTLNTLISPPHPLVSYSGRDLAP